MAAGAFSVLIAFIFSRIIVSVLADESLGLQPVNHLKFPKLL
jgi:hypothetical protein